MRKNLRRALSLLLLVMTLASCGAPAGTNATTPPSTAEPTAEFQATGEPVTVVIAVPTVSSTEKQQLARTNELVAGKGFNVTFELCEMNAYSTMERVNEAYATMIGSAVNPVFRVWPDLEEYMQNEQILLKDDITQEFMESAPRYYQSLLASGKTVNNKVPISTFYYDYPSMACILVRNDIFLSYGKQITTTSEYEDFLNFAKQNYPDLTPGSMPFLSYTLNGTDMTYPAMSLLLPEYGYYPIEKVGGQAGSNLAIKIEAPEDGLYPIETLPEFTYALETLTRWQNEGLIKLIPNNEMARYTPEDYASLFTNTRYFEGQLASVAMFENAKVTSFDASEYNMCILNLNNVPYFDEEAYVSAQDGENPHGLMFKSGAEYAEFFRFLEWLNENQDNYNYFHSGIEGEDFDIVDGKMERTESGVLYSGQQLLTYFKNYERYEQMDAVKPVNFDEVIGGLTFFTNEKLDKYAQNARKYFDEVQNAYNARIFSMSDFMYTTLLQRPPSDIAAAVFEYAQKEQENARAIIESLTRP